MTMEIAYKGFPGFAASNIATIDAGSTVTTPVPVFVTQVAGDRRFVRAGSAAQRPAGAVRVAATQGDSIAVYRGGNTIRAISAATIAAGDEVAVASSNGALGVAAAASGSVRWAVGEALQAANAGETFSVYVNPRQLSGLA